MRLLLLEDDPEMASAIQVSLARHGMVIDVVGTMAQADEALKAGVHQILLLDRQLPDGDGASFVRIARERVPNLPVIMLTARDSVADRVTGLDVGADDYLTKPFAVEELLARIRAISRRPSQITLPMLSLGRLQFDFVAREGFNIFGREGELSFEARNLLRVRYKEFQQNGDNIIFYNNYRIGTTFELGLTLKF